MIERKKKQCKGCGEMQYLWSHGYCKRCWAFRKLRNDGPNYAKVVGPEGGAPSDHMESAIKEYRKLEQSLLKPTKKHKVAKEAEYVAMRAKWKEVESRDGGVYCMECGKPLGEEMQPMFMAHVLSKGSYPSFRCDLRNIVPMCMEHHTMMDAQVDGKTRKDMRVYPELKEIEDKLKQEYYEH
jgi:hypothetical protein